MTDKDPVVGFSYDITTEDGCVMQCRYHVHKDDIKELPNAGWRPMNPTGCTVEAVLTTHYQSDKHLTIEMEGDEHVALQEDGRFDKMLASIVRGNMPGEALKRQITKAYDLPKLPKIKRPKLA